MIRVTVELAPRGNAWLTGWLGEIAIGNIGTASGGKYGDYVVELRTDDGTRTVNVYDHVRADGWERLLESALTALRTSIKEDNGDS